MEQQTEPNKNAIMSVTLPVELKLRVAGLALEREWSLAKAGNYLIRLGLERLAEAEQAQASAQAATTKPSRKVAA
jgi:hypothetical protein